MSTPKIARKLAKRENLESRDFRIENYEKKPIRSYTSTGVVIKEFVSKGNAKMIHRLQHETKDAKKRLKKLTLTSLIKAREKVKSSIKVNMILKEFYLENGILTSFSNKIHIKIAGECALLYGKNPKQEMQKELDRVRTN